MTIVLLAALLAADARPTASDVATAVELSRARLTRRNSPPTQDQIDEANARRAMASAVQSLNRTQSIVDKEARLAAIKKVGAEIERLRLEVAEAVSRQQKNRPRGTELDEFDISALAIGRVGKLDTRVGLGRLTVRCEQILGPDRSIVKITRHGWVASSTNSPGHASTVLCLNPVPEASATIVLKGLSTEAMQEGREIRGLSVNLVVIGREFLGRTLPVLEIFDPGKPFQ